MSLPNDIGRVGKPTRLSSSFDPSRTTRLWWRLRRLFERTTCRHDWEDGYAFANCVQVTISSGGRRPVSWQVMQFCAHCDAMQRRQLTRPEYFAWIRFLKANFYAGWEHVPAEDLPRDSDGSPKGGDACGSVHDSAAPSGDRP